MDERWNDQLSFHLFFAMRRRKLIFCSDFFFFHLSPEKIFEKMEKNAIVMR